MNDINMSDNDADTTLENQQKIINQVVSKVSAVLLDKEHQIRLAIACIIARGHLLIEDQPGLGKTVLAQALAAVMGLEFKRVQFTSDLLPADIIGAAVYERETASFRFHQGPVFTQVFLADEINRATPKSQSALLEAMEERQVSSEGETRPLSKVFFVIATQNPLESQGTYPLPEAQLDRFLMRISLGYPRHAAEINILAGEDRRTLLSRIEPVLNMQSLQALQKRAEVIHASPALLEYIYRLLVETRQGGVFRHGLSTRAGVELLSAARAWALMAGRNHVLPGDIQAVFSVVAGHRLKSLSGNDGQESVSKLTELVALP